MNPRVRLLSAVRGQITDRVPLVLEGFHYPQPDNVSDPGKREILDRIGNDLHFFHSCPVVDLWEELSPIE